MHALAHTVLALSLAAAVHPGHGSTVLLGTLRTVSSSSIAVDVRDDGSGTIRTEQLLVDSQTKYRVGKDPVSDPSPYVGSRVTVAADYDTDVAGRVEYRAVEVVFSPRKAKR